MKRMKWKRLGAAMLTLAMVLSVVPSVGFAVDASEQATSAASEVQAQTGYHVTVQGGHAEYYVPGQGYVEVTSAPAGTWVDLCAEEPEGKAFSHWVVEQGDVTLGSSYAHNCSFKMPAEDVTIRAEFVPGHKLTVEEFGYACKELPDGSWDYDLTAAAPGDQIEVGFDALPEGIDFSRWVVKQGHVELENPKLNRTTFTMPDEDVVISPEYQPTGWREDEVGRWYVDENGNYVTGWQIVNGFWFYFADNGYMYSGWLQDNGKWYYFGSEYSMSEEQDGSMATGTWWIHSPDGTHQYYFNPKSGEMMTGWQKVFGMEWHYFAPSGEGVNGWLYDNGCWYYLVFGGMQTGWQWIDGKCYYFYDSGAMATNTWIGGSYVDASGAWVEHPVSTGWQSDSIGWWYNDQNGNYVTGWQTINGNWYYFSGNGYMQTGWQIINGTWYYFDGNGHMLTGWQIIDGAWYYFDGNGHMMTGWQWIDGNCYYFYSSGYMATSTWIDGSYVNGSGVWVQ